MTDIASGHHQAVFLDRDGVLIEDVDLLTQSSAIRILPGVPEAMQQLHRAGFRHFVVSNQTVVARGLATEAEVNRINEEIEARLMQAGAPRIERFYICPHHPNATLPAYRVACDCRKPRPGLFLRAAAENDIDLKNSFAVGDRITDIIAGAKAGCRTILIQTGRHTADPIQTLEPIDPTIQPDYTCADLAGAAKWILENR